MNLGKEKLFFKKRKKFIVRSIRINLIYVLSGGAELLVGMKKKHDIELDGDLISTKPFTIKDLLAWIKTHLLKQRPELFMQDDTIRPGILILVNDSDWDLLGNLKYELQPNDHVTFISTLHGG